jgi:hypothetical protein
MVNKCVCACSSILQPSEIRSQCTTTTTKKNEIYPLKEVSLKISSVLFPSFCVWYVWYIDDDALAMTSVTLSKQLCICPLP